MGILVQAQIESISSRKDRTVKVVIGTQELPPDQAGELFSLNNNLANIYISANQISGDMMAEIDKASVESVDSIKSPSQRLKAVFYLNYNQNPEGFNSFDLYYLHQMEKVINHYKKKLDSE